MRTSISGAGVGQPVAEGDRVIAGVEDEQRDFAVVREAGRPGGGPGRWWQSVASAAGGMRSGVEGGGPASRDAQLSWQIHW